MFQVLIDGTNSPAYAVIDVGSGVGRPAVARDMTFDLHQEHIYVLTDNRVGDQTVGSSTVSPVLFNGH